VYSLDGVKPHPPSNVRWPGHNVRPNCRYRIVKFKPHYLIRSFWVNSAMILWLPVHKFVKTTQQVRKNRFYWFWVKEYVFIQHWSLCCLAPIVRKGNIFFTKNSTYYRCSKIIMLHISSRDINTQVLQFFLSLSKTIFFSQKKSSFWKKAIR